MTHIYSVYDGGPDYIDKEYSFIAHFSNENNAQMKKGKKGKEEGREERKRMYNTL